MKLLAGNSNTPLARSIAEYLETELTEASVRRFADEEIFVEINENVRGEDVFVVQSTSYPANDNLMELLICIDALRRASAKRITAVVPYFGYARQDRKPGPRTPISAKLVANLITDRRRQPRTVGRSPRGADPGLLRHSHGQSLRRAGDRGRHPGAPVEQEPDDRLARRRRRGARTWPCQAPRQCSAGDRRQAPGARRRIRGHEHHRRRRGPHLHPRRRYRRFGAARCATPAPRSSSRAPKRSSLIARTESFPERAAARVAASELRELVVTDSIWSGESDPDSGKIRRLTIAPLLAEAIRRIADESSVSSLFD